MFKQHLVEFKSLLSEIWFSYLLDFYISTEAERWMTKSPKAYLCLLIDVPCEWDSVVRDLLDVADCIEAFFVVSYRQKKMLRLEPKDQGRRG